MERTLETRSILQMCDRQKGSFSASFRDEAKRIYVLDIVRTQPETLEVIVQAPQGRLSPLDPLASWQITLANHRGAYQSRVTLIEKNGEFLHVRLQPESAFLARRKSIRLPTDSRNPTLLRFQIDGKAHVGYLVDFSLEGFGLEAEPSLGLNIGGVLTDGHCVIKGNHVCFTAARIVQRAYQESVVRFGLEFEILTESQEEVIRDAFNQCFSRHSTISTVLDG